jgi:hypothetical protein
MGNLAESNAQRHQRSLFDQPPDRETKQRQRRNIQSTSIDAFRRRDTSQKACIHRVLIDRGIEGATIDELSIATGVSTQSVCPAVHQLRKQNVVIDSGHRRKTRLGRNAIVWIAVGEGSVS